ncbi:MAG TPA: hypothetical protein VF679_03115 [Pedobacter sp.]
MYRFARGAETSEGKLSVFFSKNSAGTDALNALVKWCSDAPDRAYKTVEDTDDELIATLTWTDSDQLGGPSLEMHCERVGIAREFLKQN